MHGPDPAAPAEPLPYVVCDPCLDGDCASCIGLTRTRPFCGHRCGYLLLPGEEPWPEPEEHP